MAPANVTIQHVPAPSDKLKVDLGKLLSDLSADDPGLLALVGNDPSLISVLVGTWVEDGSVIGELWTATEGDELVGFMLWTPPGATSKISKEERLKFQQPLLDALSPEGMEYFKSTYYDEFPTFVMQSIAPALLDEVWWLRVAMVRADRQGLGIARALLEPVRHKASHNLLRRTFSLNGIRNPQVSALGQDIACSATRAQNVAVYNGLGFESRGVREMVSPWHTWSLYVFLLPPQKL